VQGFNENASVLGMLAVYAALVALDVPIVDLMWGFGGTISAAMVLLIARKRVRGRLLAGLLRMHPSIEDQTIHRS